MRRFLKTLLFVVCAVLLVSGVGAQEETKPHQKETPGALHEPCGNPYQESQLWIALRGRVTEIVDARTILVLVEGSGRSVKVQLAGVGKSTHREFSDLARQFLREKLLNKDVDVLVNPSSSEKLPPKIIGVAHLAGGPPTHPAYELLSNGLARFETPPPYRMSYYDQCRYKHAEAEARARKIGIWSESADE